MSKTIIAVRHFGLGGRESLETAVTLSYLVLSQYLPYMADGVNAPISGMVSKSAICSKIGFLI